jgi:hypothetical protein
MIVEVEDLTKRRGKRAYFAVDRESSSLPQLILCHGVLAGRNVLILGFTLVLVAALSFLVGASSS